MLNPEQVRQFKQQGFLLGGSVLDDAEVDRLRAEKRPIGRGIIAR